MREHQKCKEGKNHVWKKVVKCVKGEELTKEGFDYKTKDLKKDLFAFEQCGVYQGTKLRRKE